MVKKINENGGFLFPACQKTKWLYKILVQFWLFQTDKFVKNVNDALYKDYGIMKVLLFL